MALRGAYEHNDSDDSEKEEERGEGLLTGMQDMAVTYTNSQLDAALMDYESESGQGQEDIATSSNVMPCSKHSECLHAKGDKHPGRCIYWDEDEKRRTIIPDDDSGWNIAKPMKVVQEKPPIESARVRALSKKAKEAVAPVQVAAKVGGKRKAPTTFEAAMQAADKASKNAVAAERAAKQAKIEAAANLKEAAKIEKDRLRRVALSMKRDAQKTRLAAEKKARQQEAEADEMERMAAQMSQEYN